MTSTSLPGHELQPEEITCPSCGHFVGALTRCPRCGARVAKRLSVRVFRYAALLLGTVGLGLLYLMAIHREIPLIKIGEIKPMMNFAYVRIAGTVSGDVRVFKEGSRIRSLRFMVDDGTGELSITAFRAQAEKMAEIDRIPRAGDRVELAGSLSISADDNIVLRIQVPEQIKVARADVPATLLAEVAGMAAGSGVLVEGTIMNVIAPRQGSKAPWKIVLQDSSGQQELSFWQDIYEDIQDKTGLVPGATVRARVSVTSYRDKTQLSLDHAADLEFTSSGKSSAAMARTGVASRNPPRTKIGDITEKLAGKSVRIVGEVANIKQPEEDNAPFEVTLTEADKTVTLVYWDKVAENLDSNKPFVGALLEAVGTVSVYKEKLQVKITRSDKIKLLDTSPQKSPGIHDAAASRIRDVSKSMAGKTMTLRGKLGEPSSIKSGVIFPLSDGSGTIKLVLWDRKIPGNERDGLSAGILVLVSGEIVDYKGDLEIVPPNSQSIQSQEGPVQ